MNEVVEMEDITYFLLADTQDVHKPISIAQDRV